MANDILVINAGSSSIKVSLFAISDPEPHLELSGQVEGIGTDHPRAVAKNAKSEIVLDERWPAGDGPKDHGQAMTFVVDRLRNSRPNWKPAGIGHRIVHGGTKYPAPVLIDGECRAFLNSLVAMAPLHIPGNLKGIDAAMAAFPNVPEVACFDTSFHQGRAFVSETYGLPREYYDQGVRRFGFHGLSYEYVVHAMRKLAPKVADGRMVVAHLGNGASMCAINAGKSIETTMGYTAIDGLPMGTRCGQLDPGVVLALLINKKMQPMEIVELLHKKSGLLGLSGLSSDMRDLLASDSLGAQQAIEYFVYRATYYVGALAAVLGGIDGLVFTGGIGEHAAPIRGQICRNLTWLGLELDERKNDRHEICLTTQGSRVTAWAVPANEELMISLHVQRLLRV